MIIVELFVRRLLISVSFISFSEVLSYSFNWNIFLCLLILLYSLFVSTYQVNQLSLPVLKEWSYLGHVLWGSEAQSCLATRAKHSMAASLCGLCVPSSFGVAVVHWWVGLVPRLAAVPSQGTALRVGFPVGWAHWHNRLEGEFQNGACQHWHYKLAQDCKKLYCQCFSPGRVSQLVPASPADASRLVSRTPSPMIHVLFNWCLCPVGQLVFGSGGSACEPFKSGFLIPAVL